MTDKELKEMDEKIRVLAKALDEPASRRLIRGAPLEVEDLDLSKLEWRGLSSQLDADDMKHGKEPEPKLDSIMDELKSL